MVSLPPCPSSVSLALVPSSVSEAVVPMARVLPRRRHRHRGIRKLQGLHVGQEDFVGVIGAGVEAPWTRITPFRSLTVK